ncbi:uncharacterized protein LY89DRAFT_731740 [Mollisia scopiformis]|uniref:Uncharacterized protein n=1 Tax=Mollisia scopiformis TaxID=149040 RepID=A0A194XGP2_MOLSC|nr:uncharacterized protein LY89DRAFT_731740 [Mollisia scopiformis]KUJ19338.1 hypothetical protein LY89DRAFT_731740 [Mollisia scopiformis]
MDEATRLVTELQSKLVELDQRIWQYRRDMASEFDKYAEDLLRDVPKEVSETVSKSIAESMKGCKSLYPDSEAPFESCATGTHILPNGNNIQQPSVSPAPISFLRPASNEEDSPRSPHEREKEFRGLFTPSYLPLLDSTNRNERRSSADLASPPPGNISPQPKAMDPLHVDASTDTRSLVTSPETTRPSTPRRRNTDEASVGSDWSEGTARRSALRRSSSSSRHSPRRVRFEVAGEEVLPTASPRATKSVLTEEIPPTLGDDMDEEAGSEQIEDVDEAPPKRISSSQALRALSRSPLVDDGTTWTTVTAPPDGSASVATTNGFSLGEEDDSPPLGNGISQLGSSDALGPLGAGSSLGQLAVNNGITKNEVETTSDDDLLDMPLLRRQGPSPASMLSPVKMLSPANPTDISNNKSPTASTRPSRAWQDLENLGHHHTGSRGEDLKFDAGDDDEMFNFDENAERQSSPAGQDDEEYDDFDTDAPVSPISKESVSRFSTSPARDIIRPSPPKNAVPTTKGVVGSYKGHPFSMPIVSPDIHAQAASLGDVNTFVGSVDGRSGVDESDLKSFKMSGGIGSFSGTPRSLSERMIMEDMRQAEAAKKGE